MPSRSDAPLPRTIHNSLVNRTFNPENTTMTTHTVRALPAGIVGKSTRYNVDPRKICFREGWNNRFDMGDIESLAAGIQATLERTPDRPYATDMDVKRLLPSDPRTAAGFNFEVITGHRRKLATDLLLAKGVVFPEGVNVYLVDAQADERELTIKLFTENNQKPLLPLEEAAAFKRLKDNNMTILQIAKAVGRADTHVIETLALLDADQELQDAVKSGAVGATIAKVIATTARGDKQAQKEMVAEAKVAKGKDGAAKAAKARLAKRIADTKAAKAAAKGKVLKIRALTDEQLSELGSKQAKLLEVKTKEAWPVNTFKTLEDMVEAMAKDEKLAAAFTLGTVFALRAAAGMKVDLDI